MRAEERQDLVKRMKRIEGQARGIQRMLEEGRQCEEVVLQIAAVRAALGKVAMALIGDHLKECMSQESSERQHSLEQAAKLFLRFS